MRKMEKNIKQVNFRIKHNSPYFSSVSRPLLRSDLNAIINKLSFNQIYKKYVPKDNIIKLVIKRIRRILGKVKRKIRRKQ